MSNQQYSQNQPEENGDFNKKKNKKEYQKTKSNDEELKKMSKEVKEANRSIKRELKRKRKEEKIYRQQNGKYYFWEWDHNSTTAFERSWNKTITILTVFLSVNMLFIVFFGFSSLGQTLKNIFIIFAFINSMFGLFNLWVGSFLSHYKNERVNQLIRNYFNSIYMLCVFGITILLTFALADKNSAIAIVDTRFWLIIEVMGMWILTSFQVVLYGLNQNNQKKIF